MTTAISRTAIHANILHCLSNPDKGGPEAIVYIENGTLLIENGHVVAHGPTDSIAVPDDTDRLDLSAKLIVPGFVDTHIHYPQVDIMASYGTQLLDWLER
ncbi:MAG: guanine deaminase [Granulosicoccus sp.]